MLSPIMQELLQRIDPDFYRMAQLLMARAELARLRQAHPALAGVTSPGEIAFETVSPQSSSKLTAVID